MLKRFISLVGIAVLMLSFAACHNKKVSNPIAQVDSKQPDKILFDRAMEAMKANKFDVARLTLQTLINTYPDSEYVARAKLAVGDSWYAEGGSAAMIQAENEYKDFITFFPNMPEAAEAQLKIANIHYREMEKPDRDFTHALRAEDEYRTLITQFPDSKLVPEAKQRLLEVQEVLAEREFRIGKFYYSRESWTAAVARLRSLEQAYPLYSGIDEALFLLGAAYEREAQNYRDLQGVPEAIKGRAVQQAEDDAAAAYAKIITRYPGMDRAADAKRRLEDLRRPVPTPTAEAIALNKKEQESRSKTGMFSSFMLNLHKGPDVAQATKVGEPTMENPKVVSAPALIEQANANLLKYAEAAASNGKLEPEIVKNGALPPNEAAPRSDDGLTPAVDPNGVPELQPITNGADDQGSSSSSTPPPTQLNEVNNQPAADAAPAASSSSSSGQKADDSTSKKKQKKGLRKIIPF